VSSLAAERRLILGHPQLLETGEPRSFWIALAVTASRSSPINRAQILSIRPLSLAAAASNYHNQNVTSSARIRGVASFGLEDE